MHALERKIRRMAWKYFFIFSGAMIALMSAILIPMFWYVGIKGDRLIVAVPVFGIMIAMIAFVNGSVLLPPYYFKRKRYRRMIEMQEGFPGEFDRALEQMVPFSHQKDISYTHPLLLAGDWFVSPGSFAIKRKHVTGFEKIPGSDYKRRPTMYIIHTKGIDLGKRQLHAAIPDGSPHYMLENWMAGRPIHTPLPASRETPFQKKNSSRKFEAAHFSVNGNETLEDQLAQVERRYAGGFISQRDYEETIRYLKEIR